MHLNTEAMIRERERDSVGWLTVSLSLPSILGRSWVAFVLLKTFIHSFVALYTLGKNSATEIHHEPQVSRRSAAA